MSRSAAAPRTSRASGVSAGVLSTGPESPLKPAGYFDQSASPLTSLFFLIPFLVLYEVGTRWYASDPVSHVEQRIIAFSLVQRFFGWFGASGKYLPAMAVVGILLAWHVARNEAWDVHPTHLIFMLFESVFYSVPLVALGYAFVHYLPLHINLNATTGGTGNWPASIVLSLGAGVYEEMVFRLVAFTVMNMLFIDVLKMESKRALLLMVLTSATLFSAYHYLGAERFEWRSFTFRTVAGVYFGTLFVFRGFGITAASHSSYDILIVALRTLARP